MNILPGILENSYEAIEGSVAEVVSSTHKVHVDVCDGIYVQAKTWPYSHIKTGRIEENFHISKLQTEDMGLPFWEKTEYQFDLMIKDPWRTIPVWAQAGATSVVIHPTSCESKEKVLESIALADSLFMEVYISYTYDEWMLAKDKNSEALTAYGVVGLQCMTIKTIGVQGQPFDVRWLEELAFVKETYPNLLIQFDGGVDEDIPEDVAEKGVTSLVIGSAIFKEGNANENLNFFKHMFS
ncbi:MAG: hypothetical protein V4576_04280 [Patescibacteria group bacterium]